MLKKIKDNIDKTLLGATTCIVFFVIQYLWYAFDRTYLVPMWIVQALLIAFYICCVIIYTVCKSKAVEIQYQLPHVHTFRIVKGNIVLIVKKNELFSLQSLVTIYQQESAEDLEIAIGIGVVETINPQGNMQIVIIEALDSDIIQRVFNPGLIGTINRWKSIYVKPTISQEYLERRLNHE